MENEFIHSHMELKLEPKLQHYTVLCQDSICLPSQVAYVHHIVYMYHKLLIYPYIMVCEICVYLGGLVASLEFGVLFCELFQLRTTDTELFVL